MEAKIEAGTTDDQRKLYQIVDAFHASIMLMAKMDQTPGFVSIAAAALMVAAGQICYKSTRDLSASDRSRIISNLMDHFMAQQGHTQDLHASQPAEIVN